MYNLFLVLGFFANGISPILFGHPWIIQFLMVLTSSLDNGSAFKGMVGVAVNPRSAYVFINVNNELCVGE